MDGQVAVMDTATSGLSTPILVGSTGGVKPAIYGLKISAGRFSASDVLFEVTSTDLGLANGSIQTVKMPNGSSVALLGNGVGSASNTAKLIQVDLATGALTAIDTGVGSADTPNGLSAATPLSVNGKVVAAYAGDMQGNLWRFPVKADGSGFGAPTRLFTTEANQPISAAPALSAQVSQNSIAGYYVYFGTGKPVDRTDFFYNPGAAAQLAQQSIYGVFDVGGASTATITRSQLVQLSEDLKTGQISGTADLRIKKGWYFDLLGATAKLANTGAERVTSAVQYDRVSNAVTAVTFSPLKSACTNADAGFSRLMVLPATPGGSASMKTIDGTTASYVYTTGTVGGMTTVSGGKQGQVYMSNSTNKGTNPIVDPRQNPKSPSCTDNGGTTACQTRQPSSLKRSSWIQLY